MTPVGPVTDETVALLRCNGAPQDLIEFADRHVARYSQADIARVQSRAFWLGVLVATAIVAVVRMVS